MENEAGWHGTAPSKEQCEKALEEIGGDNIMGKKIATREAYGKALARISNIK